MNKQNQVYGFLLIGFGHETERRIRKANVAAVLTHKKGSGQGQEAGGASWPYSATPGS
jgi:hypothetical protein